MNDPIRKFKNILLEAHMMSGGKISKLEAHYTDRGNQWIKPVVNKKVNSVIKHVVKTTNNCFTLTL